MITKLEKHFIGTSEVKGFEFTQLKETDKYYIYLVKQENSAHFEVFEKRTVPIALNISRELGIYEYSDTDCKEIYPKSKNFGVWAWTTKTYDKALSYIKE